MALYVVLQGIVHGTARLHYARTRIPRQVGSPNAQGLPGDGRSRQPLARPPVWPGNSASAGARFQPGAGGGNDLSHHEPAAHRGSGAVAVGGGRGWPSAQVLRAHAQRAGTRHPHGRDLDTVLCRARLPNRTGIERQKSGATSMTRETQVNDYLVRLRALLTGMTVSEREDIVEEIRMHIRERSSESQISVESVLAGLGPAGELAEQYRTGVLVQRARTSISPVVILRASLRWAATGVEGFLVFVIALIGYATGFCFLLLALMKPFFPRNTGLWIGPDQFAFNFRMGATMTNPASPVHEVLGWWLIPVCLVIGSLSLALTTKLLQFLMGRFHWKVPFTSTGHARPAMMSL